MQPSNHPRAPRLIPARGLVAIGAGLGLAEGAALVIGGAAMPAAIALPCLGGALLTGYLIGHGRARPHDLPGDVPAESAASTRHLPGTVSQRRPPMPGRRAAA